MPAARAKYCLRLPDGTYLAGIAAEPRSLRLTACALMRTHDRSHSVPLTLARALALQRQLDGTVCHRTVQP